MRKYVHFRHWESVLKVRKFEKVPKGLGTLEREVPNIRPHSPMIKVWDFNKLTPRVLSMFYTISLL